MKEIPHISANYQQYKGLKIIGTSSDAQQQRWIDAIKKNNMNWIQIRNAGKDRIGTPIA